jgi:EpsI family protein
VAETNLEKLPMEIGGFIATDDFFPDSVYRELNADLHVYRHYRSADGRQVDLYIGYYGTAKGGRSSHNPYACLPGAGWGIVDTYLVKISPVKYSGDVSVNYVLARKDDVHEVLFHWYQSAGKKILATGFQQNIQRFLGRLFHNRNDGAFVQVSVRADQEGITEAKTLAKSFSEKVVVLLPEYWPVE